MDAKHAAISFRDWAIRSGLYDHQANMAGTHEADYSPSVFSAFGTEIRDVLTKKRVELVGYNERGNCVVVYTGKKLTQAQLKSMPKTIANAVQIEYRVGAFGGIGGKNALPAMFTPPCYMDGSRYACGSSIYMADKVGAGTLGALVRNAHGTLHGLSNNHVTGGCSYSETGLPILAPGAADVAPGRCDPFTIGHHASALPLVPGSPDNVDISNNSDAAIFRIKEEAAVSSMQGPHYDTPTTVAPIFAGAAVSKVGRTTGLTHGIVRARGAGPQWVNYHIAELSLAQTVCFDHYYIIEGGNGQPFARPGDSGALAVANTSDGMVSIGLVFAGNGSVSFLLPLADILQKLQCTLVSQHR